MGLTTDSFPILFLLSRRAFLLLTLLVFTLLVFTLSPTTFLPSPVSGPPAHNPNGHPNGTPSSHHDLPPQQPPHPHPHPHPPPPPPPPPPTRPENSNNDIYEQLPAGKGPHHATTQTLGSMPSLGTVLPSTLDQPARRLDPACDAFPDTSNILLIMKTGATEAFDKLPTQFMTVLKCVPEYFVWSDLEQNISGYHVRDSLESVLDEAKDDNPDFDLYRRQKKCQIDQTTCTKNYGKFHNTRDDGWNLDKYKNIHIAEKTYALRPNYDWYVTVDADTYVLWPTLVQWLARMDPREKHYLGSVTMLAGFPFGHGGSGYILSQGAMREYAGKHKNIGNEYDVQTKDVCCGDYMLARSLKDKTGIDVKQMWPTINGEKPYTLPFGKTHWCHPIVTMHHLNAEELSSFYNYEATRYPSISALSTPMLLKDIYHYFVAPKLQDLRNHWDNLSGDRFLFNRADPPASLTEYSRHNMPADSQLLEEEKVAWESETNCQRACSVNKECYQWRFHDGVCALGWSWKMGEPREEEDGGRWTSGWEVERIKAFVEAEGECSKIHWPSV